MAKKISTRELGLVLGARLLKTEDLHYGFWTPDLAPTLGNLPRAQEAYSDKLIGHIPEGVHSILDVGCGTGHLAKLLLERGYEVEAVSPAAYLTERARDRLGDAVRIHESTLEALRVERRFDLVLFSESFQYIPYTVSLSKVYGLLKPKGHVLISDFFATDAPGRSALRGGHRISEFRAFLATQPYTILTDLDITEQTAPNLKIVDDWLRQYAQPLWESLGWYLKENRPWLSRLGRWVFGRKLDKVQHKYFSGQRNAEAFKTFKTYRQFLLQKRD